MQDDGNLGGEPGENDNREALPQPGKAELAAALAARVCHDLINPAGAISTGVDLIEDGDKPEMREDAIGLIVESSKKLGVLLPFYRVAFGASASADTFDVRKLEEMTRDIYSFQRAELAWDVPFESLGKATIGAAQMIDPHRRIDQDHGLDRCRRRGATFNAGCVPPSRARRLALSRSTSARSP